MEEPSSSAATIICQKTSNRSQVFSVPKFGLCLLKYSYLVSLTRQESQLNVSRGFAVSALYGGITSCHLERGVQSGFPGMRPHWEVRHLPGLERDVTIWAWAKAQVQERKEPWGQTPAQGRKLLVGG